MVNNLKKKEILHIVGIGASAGGFDAIEKFFRNMPETQNLAYVVIQHLSPDYKSYWVDLFKKFTTIPVYQAEEGMEIAPNTIYLIPPGKSIKIFHKKLLLSDLKENSIINYPINIFLQSLAEDIGENAIGVILSGSGSDGALGIRAIKAAGGNALIQDEATAEFSSMPKSAISTSMVDFICPPENMPGIIINHI